MDRLYIKYDNLKDVIITRTKKVPVVRRFGHPFLVWSFSLQSYLVESSLQSYLVESFNANPCYLTDVELRRLHRRFGYLSVNRLQKLLDKTGYGYNTDRSAIEELTRLCHHC